MAGIMPRVCRWMAGKAHENMKGNNLRKALRIIVEESKLGRTSVTLKAEDVLVEGQPSCEADSHLIGYVAASLRTLGYKTTIVHEVASATNLLEVSWVA